MNGMLGRVVYFVVWRISAHQESSCMWSYRSWGTCWDQEGCGNKCGLVYTDVQSSFEGSRCFEKTPSYPLMPLSQRWTSQFLLKHRSCFISFFSEWILVLPSPMSLRVCYMYVSMCVHTREYMCIEKTGQHGCLFVTVPFLFVYSFSYIFWSSRIILSVAERETTRQASYMFPRPLGGGSWGEEGATPFTSGMEVELSEGEAASLSLNSATSATPAMRTNRRLQ